MVEYWPNIHEARGSCPALGGGEIKLKGLQPVIYETKGLGGEPAVTASFITEAENLDSGCVPHRGQNMARVEATRIQGPIPTYSKQVGREGPGSADSPGSIRIYTWPFPTKLREMKTLRARALTGPCHTYLKSLERGWSNGCSSREPWFSHGSSQLRVPGAPYATQTYVQRTCP